MYLISRSDLESASFGDILDSFEWLVFLESKTKFRFKNYASLTKYSAFHRWVMQLILI